MAEPAEVRDSPGELRPEVVVSAVVLAVEVRVERPGIEEEVVVSSEGFGAASLAVDCVESAAVLADSLALLPVSSADSLALLPVSLAVEVVS